MDETLRVLHVDDEQFADLTKARLEADNEAFVVCHEVDGAGALDRLADEAASIDCLLVAYQLPGMDGLELLRAVRQQFPASTLPVVLFTSEGTESVAADALNAGASGYVRKSGPAPFESVAERIRRDVRAARRQESGTRFEALSQAIGDPIYLLDSEGRFTFVNDAFVELVGYERERLLGSQPDLIKSDGAVATGEAQLRRLLSNPDLDGVTFEVEIQPADGPPIPCEDHMGTLPQTGDGFEGTIGVLRDVSDRKATEERLAAIVRNSADLISVLDADGRVVESSPALEPMLGYSPGALEGEHVFEYVHPADRDRVAATFAEMVGEDCADTRRVEYRFERADGSWCWLESVGSARGGDTLDGYTVVSRDVTERKDRERRFRRTLERMQDLIRSESRTELAESAVRIADSGISLPLAGMHLETDDGTTLAGVAGNDAVDDYFDEVPSYDRRDGDREVDRLLWEAYESGSQVIVNDIADSDAIVTDETPIRSTILQPIPGYGVFVASAPEPDGVDDIDRILVEMLATNLTAVFDRLQHNERIERQRDDLEILNQVLRHDIRNDLQVVSAHLGLLDDRLDQPAVREHVETATHNARHASELTETAGRIADAMLLDDEATSHSPLREAVTAEVETLRMRYPNTTVSVEGSIPAVDVPLGDLLNAVLENVLTNAVQHNDTDTPTVRVSAERAGEYVTVEIADDGPGVPDGQKPTIFGQGEHGLDSDGTGMGLYLVETLVSRAGGSVAVADNDPRGAVFVLELPVV